MKNFSLRLLVSIAMMLPTFASVAQSSKKLSGSIIGTQYSVDYDTNAQSTTVNTKANVFDGN